MHIQRITYRHRRDFSAVYKCEHCGDTREGGGYDDEHFHEHVIPSMVCKSCGKSASSDYAPAAPKYNNNAVV